MLNLQTILLLIVNISAICYLQTQKINNNLYLDISFNSPIINTQNNLSTLEEKAKAISVKIISGDSWGTGILINKQDNTYTVLTNAHVVRENDLGYQIQTIDRKLHTITDRLKEGELAGYDLALLTFTSEQEYSIATLGDNPPAGEKVIAVGFPYLTENGDARGIVYLQGNVWQMLPKPMEEGYQVGYSSLVEKGMSGGAVMNMEGEVVAINGMHPYPLWGNPYVYEDGDIPAEKTLQKMSEYSWGIPIDRVKDVID